MRRRDAAFRGRNLHGCPRTNQNVEGGAATDLRDKLRTLTDDLARGERRSSVGKLSRLADQLDATAGAGTEHARRVAAYASATAREFGIGGRELLVLEVGAALHDLGKLCVRKTVLTKPGPLTEQEWDVMRLHPAAGARVLSTMVGVPEVAAIVRWHHERWDGTGYPDGLRGERIPLGARIVAVADAFQAMIETRPYRGPLSEGAARARLREAAGTQFDPACVDAFEASLTSVAA